MRDERAQILDQAAFSPRIPECTESLLHSYRAAGVSVTRSNVRNFSANNEERTPLATPRRVKDPPRFIDRREKNFGKASRAH
jgi:hypothetical protein